MRLDYEVRLGWPIHWLYHIQTICTSLWTDRCADTYHSIFMGWVLFLMPSQHCQSTQGENIAHVTLILIQN